MNLNGCARNLNIDKFLAHTTLNTQLNARSTLSAHKFDHGVLRNLLSRNHPIVNLNNAVTRAYASLRGWALWDDTQHGNCICRGVKDNTYAIKLTLQRLINLREHLRRDIL